MKLKQNGILPLNHFYRDQKVNSLALSGWNFVFPESLVAFSPKMIKIVKTNFLGIPLIDNPCPAARKHNLSVFRGKRIEIGCQKRVIFTVQFPPLYVRSAHATDAVCG